MKKYLIALVLVVAVCVSTSAQQKTGARINHLAIFVKDLARSTAFYRDIVGLDTIPEPFHDNKHTWMRIGPGASMHIIEGASEKKEYYKNNHICFSVTNIEQFITLLRQKGFSWEDVSGKKMAITRRVDGVHQIWLQDPDGYWLEINDAKD